MRGFRSLRWRLTALIGAVVVLSVGATFVAVYRGTGTQLRNQIDRELRADADAFGRAGVPAGAPVAAEVERAAHAYISNQPFRGSSRLLIVVLPAWGRHGAPCSPMRFAWPGANCAVGSPGSGFFSLAWCWV